MITPTDIELLQGLTKKTPHAVKLEGGKFVLYSKWFALELPIAQMDPAFDGWEEVAHSAALNWRSTIPAGDGEYGQGMRWTSPDEDKVPLIRLMSDQFTAIIHPSMYDLILKKFPTPEFRLFEGDKPIVAIYSEGTLIGGVAQMKTGP